MPTANQEVKLCRCGHGDDHHGATGSRPMGCRQCSCQEFQAAQVNLKEGEQIRRLTED